MTSQETGITVDREHLDQVTTRIKGYAGFITDHLAALEADAKGIVGLWAGEAAAAYDEAHREWVDGAGDVSRGVAAMETAARAAHGNYGAASTANTKMFKM